MERGIPSSVIAGQSYNVPFTISNVGVGPTVPTTWKERIYINNTPSVSGAVYLSSYTRTGVVDTGSFYSASFNFNTASFFAKWLKDLASEQKEDGSVPWVVPNIIVDGGGTGWSDGFGATGWADAAVVIP